MLQCHGFLRDEAAFTAAVGPYRAALRQKLAPVDTDLRMGCYLAHHHIDAGRPEVALEALRAAAAPMRAPGVNTLLAASESNPFFRAACLKAGWAARSMGREVPSGLDEVIPDLASEWLDADHPNEALAFWGAMLLQQRMMATRSPDSSRADYSRAQALAGHLASIAGARSDWRDVAGVKLAAYWRTLANYQLLRADGLDDFTDSVTHRSSPATAAWLASIGSRPDPRRGTIFASSPQKLAALAPLTFSHL